MPKILPGICVIIFMVYFYSTSIPILLFWCLSLFLFLLSLKPLVLLYFLVTISLSVCLSNCLSVFCRTKALFLSFSHSWVSLRLNTFFFFEPVCLSVFMPLYVYLFFYLAVFLFFFYLFSFFYHFIFSFLYLSFSHSVLFLSKFRHSLLFSSFFYSSFSSKSFWLITHHLFFLGCCFWATSSSSLLHLTFHSFILSFILFLREGLIVPIHRCFGKLNSTFYGNLQRQSR